MSLGEAQARSSEAPSVCTRLVTSIGSWLAPESIFEFGCNAGERLNGLRERVSPQPKILRGCDTNAESVSHGREAFGLDLSVGNASFLETLRASSFDLVFAVSTLCSASNAVDGLAELARIARRHVLLLEPTGGSLKEASPLQPLPEGSDVEPNESEPLAMCSRRLRAAAMLLGLRPRAHVPTPLGVTDLGPYYEIHLYEKAQGRIRPVDRVRTLLSKTEATLSFPDGRYPHLSRLLGKDVPPSNAGRAATVRFVLDAHDVDAFEREPEAGESSGFVVLCEASLVERFRSTADRVGVGLQPIHAESGLVLLSDLSTHVPKEKESPDPHEAVGQMHGPRKVARLYGLSILDWHEETVANARRAQAKELAVDRSLKYRIGEAMIRAARPSRDTLLLPARLWELYREAKGKSRASTQARKRRRRILQLDDTEIRGLFFATNGVGLGHLTRSLAIARRLRDLEPGAELTFITTCHATHLVEEQGFVVYHVPSVKEYDGLITLEEWNRQLRKQLRRLIEDQGAHFLAFDGAQPYDGLADLLRSKRKTLTRVWVKRGQLKASLEEMRQHKMNLFDLVIEPGEVGGPEPEASDGIAQWVAPITLLGEEDLLSREAAAAHLGIDPTRRAVLLLLGAGNINDTESLTHQAIAVAQELDAQVVVAESPIAKARVEAPEGVVIAKEYPISRLFRAFDLTIAAAGYNTVAELCRFDVPSILIPNENTGADDQVARAMAAAELGNAHVLRPFSRGGLERAMGEHFSSAAERPGRPAAGIADGARQAAEQIRRLVRTPDA